ncbi:PRC-barrel domain-containing protein [Archaeoglobus sp.]
MITVKSLSKKIVTLSDGTIIGKLYNIIADFRTGTLLKVLVKPTKEVDGFEMEDGLYVIPFECVKAISDYIVVDMRK